MTFANGHGGQPVQEPAHHLRTGLRRGIRGTAGNDNGAVTVAAGKARRAEPLGETADEPDGAGRAERRPEVVIHLVAKAGVADLVQPEDLVEALRTAVGLDKPV
jgi:hypothetical protein